MVTRPARIPEVEDPEEHSLCTKILRDHGIKVIEKKKFHFKAVMIDDSIIYVGSINPLQIITVKYTPADYMLRSVSEALVDEITERFVREYQDWLK